MNKYIPNEKWIVCVRFPVAGYRHAIGVHGPVEQFETLRHKGAVLLYNWAKEKNLNMVGAEFQIHPADDKSCLICRPAPHGDSDE